MGFESRLCYLTTYVSVGKLLNLSGASVYSSKMEVIPSSEVCSDIMVQQDKVYKVLSEVSTWSETWAQ